jgi:hypothetical protein
MSKLFRAWQNVTLSPETISNLHQTSSKHHRHAYEL